MTVATKDGPWISAIAVTRIDCSKCGTVLTTRWPTNDREVYELIRMHAQTHGGINR